MSKMKGKRAAFFLIEWGFDAIRDSGELVIIPEYVKVSGVPWHIHATLRRGDTVEFITLERGLELLAGRRAWEAENGGTPKKAKRSSVKKSAQAHLKSVTPKHTIKRADLRWIFKRNQKKYVHGV